MTHPLRFGLKLSGQDCTIQDLRSVWRIADEGGFDHVWDFDHLASIGAGGPDRTIYEGWTLQAAMAEATKRVRIGCLVTGNTYRNPVVLAKMAVTVDHLSGGRLEFGMGAAWAEIEHEMYGIGGLDHRVGYLSESLQIIKSLFTQERTNFEGRYYHFKDAIANPKPFQKPHPPFWIGASGATTLRLVARHADVWNISGGDPKLIAGLIGKFEEACGAVGRDQSEIRRSLQFSWDGKDKNELIDLSGRLLELGITEQVIYLRGGQPVALAEKVAELLPELRHNDPQIVRSNEEVAMADTVYRVTELIGTSSQSWEAAARTAVETAAKSLRDLRVGEVVEQDMTIENGKVTSYRVKLNVSFKYEPEKGPVRRSARKK